MSLDPSVSAQLGVGEFALVHLVRFDLPGKTVGYHNGGRPYTYNGLTYLPNRWLSIGDMRGDLGVAVSARTLTFSNIPVSDLDDAIARLEDFQYQNAPVIIAHLLGEPESNTVLGLLTSHTYEINEVSYEKGAVNDRGERTLTLTIELEPPGRSARGQTYVKRSMEEQRFDNDASDTGLEYVATNVSWPRRWGQRSD